MPFHHTCRTTTLAGAGNIDSNHVIKQINTQFLAHRQTIGRTTKFLNESLGLAVCLDGRLDACC
jgi:hypothetical protein